MDQTRNIQKIYYKWPFLITLSESFIFSLTLIYITSGLSILNPKRTDWLSVGDGTGEISWEFFRSQPLFQFPLGLNPKYGLEISNTAALDGQIPIMSFLFHPFSEILPERFQYYGLFIFFTFVINFYFAKKIFLHVNFNKYQSVISAITLATSPIILNRFIESTHYALTAAWIIFAAILLSLRSSSKFHSWSFLIILTILIHPYYLPFIFTIYFVNYLFRLFSEGFKIQDLINAILLLVITFFGMYVVGYFFGGVSGKDVGYGLFRTTLISIFDSSGWSRIIPDIGEPDGAYEGFAYLGSPGIFLLILNLIMFRKIGFKPNEDKFIQLWISAVILFVFALSNKIAIGNIELFSFRMPEVFSLLTNSFRSTGRFAWLIVFILNISLVFSLKKKISSRILSIILTLALIIGLIDHSSQLISQKENKFSTKYKSTLTDSSWNSISECYSKIRVYPPTAGVENVYNFVNLAYKLDLGINTGRYSRVNQNSILGAYDLMHKEFNTGIYRTDSFYVFTNADFVLPEIVDYQKRLAVHTLNNDSAYGELNGYSFIAPNLKKCVRGDSLKSAAKGFGAPETQTYRGETLAFGKGLDSSKYILIGFSALEDWGVWSVDEVSKISLNTDNISKFSTINIYARDLASPANEISVSINDSKIGNCKFTTDFTTCSLPFNFTDLKTNIISLRFTPKIIRSPQDLGLSEDTRNLGFGMKSISFS
jgi:hypothetical protein